eukprot:757537-Hanusia_phi.AAC.4
MVSTEKEVVPSACGCDIMQPERLVAGKKRARDVSMVALDFSSIRFDQSFKFRVKFRPGAGRTARTVRKAWRPVTARQVRQHLSGAAASRKTRNQRLAYAPNRHG